ncbi:MAG: hypothetical protein GX637_05680 [Clostridiales bacterium]|nr:hypothetical protein [Clostridiales bacterium]
MHDTVFSTVSYSEKDRFFVEQKPVAMKKAGPGSDERNTIVVDPAQTYQPMFGMGSIWTDTDLHAFYGLDPKDQDFVLEQLFDPEKGAGWNFMRLPLGSTDWEVTPDFYTYDDMPRGQKDWNLEHFSIQRDIDRGFFALARRCLKVNPELKFLGSVWGMPAWMKENDAIMYGRVDPACYKVYAKYLTKAVIAFREQGIPLYAITPQNESLCGNDRATPATRETWWMQKEIILAMRREFDAAGLDTKIWIYDHNFDMSDFFVRPMLEDEACRRALDGVAFHDYGGDPFVMGLLTKEYPDVPLFMTERTIFSVSDMNNLVRELRNGARSYLQWTTMSDEAGGPTVFLGNPFVYGARGRHSRGNFFTTLRKDPKALSRGVGYGIYGQFTKYLRRDMVRVDSSYGDRAWVTTVAFRDERDGHIAVVVLNETDTEQAFILRCGGAEAALTQPAMTAATYCFTPGALSASAVCAVKDVKTREAEHVPSWDIALSDIRLNGEAKAGNALLLSAIVTNVGDLPTPPMATIHVQFSEDGDNPIARSYVPLPVLKPGESFEAVSNVPFGMPYYDRVAWTAEAGRHQIFAKATVGNADAELWTHNNILAKEYTFE